MTTAVSIALLIILLGIVAYHIYFPRNTFTSVDRPGGGSFTFWRSGVSFEPRPDRHATNAFDCIEPYVSRLVHGTEHVKSLSIFTPDGVRGFGLSAKSGIIQATFTVESFTELQKENAIRSFFNSLGIAPTGDYLAGNGGVPDAIRIIEYTIKGTAADVTLLVRRILQELCGISPTEALDIALL